MPLLYETLPEDHARLWKSFKDSSQLSISLYWCYIDIFSSCQCCFFNYLSYLLEVILLASVVFFISMGIYLSKIF